RPGLPGRGQRDRQGDGPAHGRHGGRCQDWFMTHAGHRTSPWSVAVLVRTAFGLLGLLGLLTGCSGGSGAGSGPGPGAASPGAASSSPGAGGAGVTSGPAWLVTRSALAQ